MNPAFRNLEWIVGMEETSISEKEKSSPDTLTFERLDQMIEAFSGSGRKPVPGTWEHRWFLLGVIGAAFGLLAGLLLPGPWAVFGAVAGLVLECAGLGLSMALALRRGWRSIRRPGRSFDRELDADYERYQACVGALVRLSGIERARRLRYVRDRRKVMQYRMGLAVGGLERLGVLPVLIALYLQFRGWEWGDWGMLSGINPVQGLLILALLLVYLLGWHLVLLNSRMERYELILSEAALRDVEDSLG